mmetsp:Transcript_26261/g.70950  ORF Transcript_26261/g.70950 Transcript_26261/m.70950 type:complete len:238 (+) Transcript_26261:888-1601(+)
MNTVSSLAPPPPCPALRTMSESSLPLRGMRASSESSSEVADAHECELTPEGALVRAMAPEVTTVLRISSCTSRKACLSSACEPTFFTPREAAPEMGLSTAGKPTVTAASFTSARVRTRALAGVGMPATTMAARVLYLSRATSTAARVGPGKPRCPARRVARGTMSSEKEHTPSTAPTSSSRARARSSEEMSSKSSSSAWSMFTPTNFASTPSASSARAHESGESTTTARTPSAAARS